MAFYFIISNNQIFLAKLSHQQFVVLIHSAVSLCAFATENGGCGWEQNEIVQR